MFSAASTDFALLARTAALSVARRIAVRQEVLDGTGRREEVIGLAASGHSTLEPIDACALGNGGTTHVRV